MDKPTRKIKPLYMLIKVDVDADIVYNDAKAHTYAINHCDKLEYQLIDYFYPSKYSEQYGHCLLYTSPSPRDTNPSRMPSSA